MTASTNFVVWNETGANQENDATYQADSLTTGGAVSGPNPPANANKFNYQNSTMVTSLAYMLVQKGYSPVDGSSPFTAAGTPSTAVINLATVLANLITQADLSAKRAVNATPATVTNPTGATNVISVNFPSGVPAGSIIHVSGGLRYISGSIPVRGYIGIATTGLGGGFSNLEVVADFAKFDTYINVLSSSSFAYYALATGISNGAAQYSNNQGNPSANLTAPFSIYLGVNGSGTAQLSADYLSANVL